MIYLRALSLILGYITIGISNLSLFITIILMILDILNVLNFIGIDRPILYWFKVIGIEIIGLFTGLFLLVFSYLSKR